MRELTWVDHATGLIAATLLLGGLLVLALRPDAGPSLGKFEAAILAVPPYRVGYHDFKATAFNETPQRIALAAARMGVTFEATLNLGAAARVTYASRIVEVNPEYSGDSKDINVIHELAHLLCPVMEVHGDKEMFAEAVAYLVGSREHDYLAFSAEYAARFKTSLPVLRVYRREIEEAADFIYGEGR